MATGTPVVVSRIQNRRGTQAQFDALYSTYPGTGTNVLQPGELALCTDTRRMFMGNLNGEYVELSVSNSAAGFSYIPVQFLLQPMSTWTPITALEFQLPITAFLTVEYSLTNATLPSAGVPASPAAVGTTFSKNGQLEITAINSPITATLTDGGTEINLTQSDIHFSATCVNDKIQIFYKHNFPTALTFSTSTIVWADLSAA